MKKNRSRIFISFLTIIFVFLIYISYFFSIQFLDKKFNDYFIRQTLNKKAGNDVIIVVIDDKSTNEIRWPWKRNLYTEIFEYLSKDAKVIAFDAVISSTDTENKNADDEFFHSLKNYKNLVAGFDLYPAKSNQIMPDKRVETAFNEKFKNINIEDARTKKLKPTYNSLVSMPMDYLTNIQNLGSVIIPIDKDGVIRSNFPVVEYSGRLYPSMALKAFSMTTGINDFVLTNRYLCSKSDNCKSLKIPVNQDKKPISGIYSYINWRKPYNEYYSHKTYSAIDVINSYRAEKTGAFPTLSRDVFKDKIVIVGGNANIQSLEDRRSTPVLLKHAGVDVQATYIDNILNNSFSRQVIPAANLIYMALISFFTFLLIVNFSIMFSISCIGILISMAFFIYYLAISQGIILSFVPLIAMEMIVFAFGYSYRFLIEGQKKEKIERAMGKYISKDIMDRVVKDLDELTLGGKRANVTILFADIRGFTSISEKMPAEDVSMILNEYFAQIEPIIKAYNGVINKFIGDAVMVVFGDPIPDKKHPVNAVLCANKMLQKVKTLQAKWIAQGKPKLEIGVGINTGEAFVGNIGTEERLEYTVIGDTVNIASRIESFNKVYKTRFLISQETYNHVSAIADVIKIREVTIRGKVKKINIYEVLRIFDAEQN